MGDAGRRWLGDPRRSPQVTDPAPAAATKSVPVSVIIYLLAVAAVAALAVAAPAPDAQGIHLLPGTASEQGIPLAFALFVLVLLGVAFFHHHTMAVAVVGALAITAYTGFLCPGFAWSAEQPVK